MPRNHSNSETTLAWTFLVVFAPCPEISKNAVEVGLQRVIRATVEPLWDKSQPGFRHHETWIKTYEGTTKQVPKQKQHNNLVCKQKQHNSVPNIVEKQRRTCYFLENAKVDIVHCAHAHRINRKPREGQPWTSPCKNECCFFVVG